MSDDVTADKWRELRKPFPPNQLESLPKQMRRDDRDRGKCYKGSPVCADDKPCGGYHARAIHLDYVGHAGITDRLLDVDPTWTLEPAALVDGLPAWSDGGMWFKLTILGVTRWCFGDAQGKTGANATKEVIGDALRNGAMRFGVGTYLWSKSEAAEAMKARGSEADPAGADDDGHAGSSPDAARARGDVARQIVEWSRKALQPEHVDALVTRAREAHVLDVEVSPVGVVEDVLRLARERVTAAAEARNSGQGESS